MRRLRGTLCALLCICPVVASSQERDLKTLHLLSGGYPRAFFFRQAEEAAAKQPNFAKWNGEYGGLMGIMGKALDEEVPGRSSNIELFTRFKVANPRQAVLLHMNGNSRDPRFDCEAFFAGHWLYFDGAIISADVPAESGETTIHVSDPGLFEAGGRRGGPPDDVGLCRLDVQGKPDWTRSEQVELVSVDHEGKTIRVRRGAFGGPPCNFPAGQAYAAAHCVQKPGNSQGARNRWLYNYSTTCPRDENGQNCTKVAAAYLGKQFASDGRLAAFDGLEFDTLYNEPHVSSRTRGADCDADGRRDDGRIDGVNVYGDGVVEFCRVLRSVLGEQRLIMADGSFRNEEQQRATGHLNGIESEGWPNLQDKDVADWSGGLNRQLFWRDRGRDPALNYINHKFNDPQATSTKEKHIGVDYNITRLVFAAAVFTDSAITYMLSPEGTGMRSSGVWDELVGGELRRPGWLGRPLGPAKHLAYDAPELLAGSRRLNNSESEDALIEREAEAVKVTARNSRADKIHIRLKKVPVEGGNLFVTLTARGAPMSRAAPGIARLVHAGVGSERFMSWLDVRDFTSTFAFHGLTENEIDLELTFESAEPVWISKLTAHAAPDVMIRDFEHGVVIANPSLAPVKLDLATVARGKTLRRLSGTTGQDLKTNDGSIVRGPIVLEPKDALFLIKL